MGWAAPDVRISFAQNLEDVRLWKALAGRTPGFWVDIGAADPDRWSVTRFFSERGWTGINVEPGPAFAALEVRRPHDVNVRAAIGTGADEVEFTVSWPLPDLSSLDPARAGGRPEIETTETIRVPLLTLADLLDRHAGDRRIDFLKVDVEGAERMVLASNDWTRHRPSVVVVEAIDSITRVPNHEEFEDVLLAADYRFAVFDGLNRFYVAAEDPGPAAALAAQISVFDVSAFAPELELRRELEDRVRALEVEVCGLADVVALRDRQLAEVWTSRTWRIGRVVGRVVRSPGRLVAGVRVRLGRVRRRWRSRPTAVRRIVAEVTAPGARFEVLHDGPAAFPADTPVERFVARRRATPGSLRRPMTPDELAALTAALRAGEERDPDLVASARRLVDWCTRPVGAAARAPGRTVVVDAQAVQLAIRCGTRTHALHVVDALLDGIGGRVPVRFLTAPDLPPPPPALLARVDGRWDPTHDPATVGAFVQPMCLRVGPYARLEVTPFLEPGVERLDVWLDGMLLDHDARFHPGPVPYLDLQLSVERLLGTDEVLALTRYAVSELPGDLADRARIRITGAQGAFAAPPRSTAAGGHVLVVGKVMPHKNVVAGLAGVVLAQRADRTLRGVAVVDAFPDDERDLRAVLVAVGADLVRWDFRFQPDDTELAALVAEAAVVVVPSLHEGFSLPVVEALGSGTPVVVSDIPVHRELLGDAPGFADPGDPVALAAAITDVLAHPDDRLAAQVAALDRGLTAGFVTEVRAAGSALADRLLARP